MGYWCCEKEVVGWVLMNCGFEKVNVGIVGWCLVFIRIVVYCEGLWLYGLYFRGYVFLV